MIAKFKHFSTSKISALRECVRVLYEDSGDFETERLREIFELLHGSVVALPVLAGVHAGEISARDPVRLHSQNGFHPGFNSLFKIDYENNII